MASTKGYLLIALAVIAAIAVVPVALGKDFNVGDSNGWKNNNFDYKGWAQRNEFHVGDRLIFNYKKGAHNVYKVDQAGFKDCKPADNSSPLESGSDIIDLKATGKKWYICGFEGHCSDGGMKLAIDVLPEVAAPAQPPTSSAAAAKFAALGFAAFCMVFAVMA